MRPGMSGSGRGMTGLGRSVRIRERVSGSAVVSGSVLGSLEEAGM